MPLQPEDESWRGLLTMPPELVAPTYPLARVGAPAPVAQPGLDLAVVLRQRRTVREFADTPLSGETLAAILGMAADADAAQFGAGTPEGAHLVTLVNASRVDGFPAGMYVADGPRLGRPAHASAPAALRDLYPDAPALLLVCADVTAAARALGGRGYPRALCQAGAFGYAAWLSAVSSGLVGSVYGGGTAEVTRWVRDELRTPARHLFTVAIGEKR